MTEFTLTETQKQILHDQSINAERPGPVLRDFQTLVDFVGTKGVKAGGKYNLLPMESLGELDQRLTRPLHLKFKRPQLRSHPYLQGLHLLLRASGLGRITGKSKEARLEIDPAVLEPWNLLNATEQYFTLLEAWLRVGRPEMVGDPARNLLFGGMLASCLQMWEFIPHVIGRDLYQVALMDLFGLLLVEHPRSPVQPWAPAGVRHLPFGDAVFALLGQQMLNFWKDRFLEEEDEGEGERSIRFGCWQPLFQPYFPEWRANLVLPEAEARAGVFVFRVSLGNIWRRIAIPADATLDDLVAVILESVDFDSDHLYQFTYRDRFGAEVHVLHPEDEEGPWADQVAIGELPLEPGQSLALTYDFGDSWKFQVQLEAIEPPRKRMKRPKIVERHGKAPPQYPEWD